ncbi:MAG: SURF1 family protein [Methyloprofundus sp.]|nr:SURF1 family protein [Methyloprofundus sp.]
MRVNFFNYQWKIHWLPLVIFIVVFSLLLRLGFWQLNRAAEKEQLFSNQAQRMLSKPVYLPELLKAQDEIKYRPVVLKGNYDATHQLLVDNQIVNGKLGAFVMTPFILADKSGAVLVNRGWIAMDKARLKVPDISLTANQYEISLIGRVNNFPAVGMVLKGADDLSEGWPSQVQVINLDKLATRFNYSFYSFQVQLQADQANGYLRDWKINTRMPPEKHRAYAFQWFALAATLFFLTLWISCKTHKND